jgi:hypothetical protein
MSLAPIRRKATRPRTIPLWSCWTLLVKLNLDFIRVCTGMVLLGLFSMQAYRILNKNVLMAALSAPDNARPAANRKAHRDATSHGKSYSRSDAFD